MVEVSQPGPLAEGGRLAFRGCFQSVWMWNCSFQAFHHLYNVQGEPRWPDLCFGWCTMPPEPWLSAEVRCLQAVGNTSHPQRKGCKEEETKLGFKSRQPNPLFFCNKIARGLTLLGLWRGVLGWHPPSCQEGADNKQVGFGTTR